MSGQHRLSSLLAFFFSLCVSFTTASAVDLDPSTHQAIPGDFNGDGRIDALLQPLTDSVGGALLLQDGTGNLSVVAQGWDPGYLGLDWSAGNSAITTADLNGDGLADVVIQPRVTGKNAAVLITDPTVQLLQVTQVIPMNYLGLDWSTAGHVLVAGDFDGDRQKELLLQAAAPGVPGAIVHADLSGHLVAVTQAIPDGYLNRRWDAEDVTLYVGDFNGDGRQDLLIQVNTGHEKAGESSYALLLADANGHFTQVSEVWNDSDFGGDWSPATHTLSLQDVNGDGITDIVLTAKNGGTNYLFEPNAQGQITQPTVKWTGNKSASDAFKQQASLKNSGTTMSVAAAKPAATPATSGTTKSAMMTSQVTTGNAPVAANTIGSSGGQGGVNGGNATYTVPVVIAPGIAGMQPSVSLSYSSRGGNSVAGMGWSLSGYSVISRCPATWAQDTYTLGVTYSSNDRLCLDGQHLIAVSGTYGQQGSIYRTELDSGVRVTLTSGSLTTTDASFEVDYLDGRKAYYGNNSSGQAENSELFALNNSGGTVGMALEWAIGREDDAAGNNIVYTYEYPGAGGEMLLQSIYYTGNTTGTTITSGTRLVSFSYTPRQDVSTAWLAGGKTRQTMLLASVTASSPPGELRTYNLGYITSSATNRSLLQSVQECGSASGQTTLCLPPTTFNWQNRTESYTDPQVPAQSHNLPDYDSANGGATPSGGDGQPSITIGGDYDGDGRRELLYSRGGSNHLWFLNGVASSCNIGTQFGAVTDVDLSAVATQNHVAWFPYDSNDKDLNNDGAADLVTDDVATGRMAILSWNGCGFSETVSNIPYTGAALVFDANGDGLNDVVDVEHDTTGDCAVGHDCVYLHTNTNPATLTFGPRQALFDLTANNLSLSGSNPVKIAQAGDINGDGIPDIFISDTLSSRNGYVEYVLLSSRQNGKIVYTAKTLSSLGISDTVQLYDPHYFIDINGDGLPDLVYVDTYGSSPSNLWNYQINTGTGFSVAVPTVVSDTRSTIGVMDTLQADIYNDGRQELVFPSTRLVGFCPYEQVSTEGNVIKHGNDCPGPAPQGPNGPVDGTFYSLDSVAPQQDFSIFGYAALQFVEQTDGSYTVFEDDNTKIKGQAGLAQIGDLYGDGLTYMWSPFSHWWSDAVFEDQSTFTPMNTCPAPYTCGMQLAQNIGTNSTNDPHAYRINAAPDMMLSAIDGLGVTYNWDYYPMSSTVSFNGLPFYTAPTVGSLNRETTPDYFYFASSMYVVGDYSASNGTGGANGGANVHQYNYNQAIYNNQGRGFQGFLSITDGFLPQNDPSDDTLTVSSFQQIFPLSGVLVSQKTYAGTSISGALLSDTENTPQVANPANCSPSNSVYLRQLRESVVTHNGADGAQLNSTDSTFTYDGDGNKKTENSTITDGSSTNPAETTIDQTAFGYVNDCTDWWWNQLTSKSMTTTVRYSGSYATPAISAAAGTVTRSANYDYFQANDSSPGNRRHLKDEYDDQDQDIYEKDTAYTYDSFGNPASVTVTSGKDVPIAGTGTLSTSTDYALTEARKVQTSYQTADQNNGYFLHTASNPLSQVTTYSGWDAFAGRPTEVTDPNNIGTTYTYDALGRRATEQVGSDPAISYSIVSPYSECGQDSNPNTAYSYIAYQVGYPEKITCNDMLGRVIENISAGFTWGKDLYSTTTYDVLGRVTRASEPYSQIDLDNGVAVSYTQYLGYDVLNRVREKVDPKGVDAKYTYDPSSLNPLKTEIDVTPSDPGSTTITTYEVHASASKLLSSTDANGNTTDFRYDAGGNPAIIQDSAGNQIDATYNRLGQKTAVSDPDQGNSSYAYNVLGELLQQTDANSNQITMKYDDLGRMVSKQLGSATPTTWTYDSCTHGIGKLCQVNQPQQIYETAPYQETYGYDGQSRPKSVTETINGTPYTTTTSYDSDGRVATVTYPSTVLDSPPTANAGANQTVLFGSAVTLSGANTSDSDGPSPLVYLWNETSTFTSDGVTGKTTPTTSFTPTVGGVYTFNLAVNDGLLSSNSTTSVTVNPIAPATMQLSVDGSLYYNSYSTADGTVSLQWGTSAGANSYLLFQSVNGGAYTQVASYASTTTSLTGVGSTSENDTITYKTEGYANGAYSLGSPTTNLQVMYTPPAPASVSAPANSNWDGSFTVSWAKPASGVVTGYGVSVGNYYLVDGKEQWQEAGSCSTISSGPSQVSPPSPAKSCVVAGNQTKMPANPKGYMVQVMACNSLNGAGNCSKVTSAGPVNVWYLSKPGAPAITSPAPGATMSGQYVPLIWNPSSSGGAVAYFEIYADYYNYSGQSTGYMPIKQIAAGTYTYKDDTGGSYETADYYVAACNNAGCANSLSIGVSLNGGSGGGGTGGGCHTCLQQTPQPAPSPTTSAAPSGVSGSITLPSTEGSLAVASPLPALKAVPLHITNQWLASLTPPPAPKRRRLFDYAPPAYEYYAGAVVQTASGTQQAAGITVAYQYNANGYLQELYNNLTPSVVYWKTTGVNARNEVTDEQFGGGAVTSHRNYYAKSGYIQDIQSSNAAGPVQNLHYDWFSLGNLQDRQSNLTGAPLEENFQYDALNRLTQSQVTNGAGPQNPVTYSYDNLGDVTCKSDLTGQTCGPGASNYGYGGTSGGPHAVTSVNGSWSGTAFSNSYSYDADGNLKTRLNGVTGVTTSIAWNSDNLPICMDSANTAACNETGAGANYSQFVYAPDKHRYYQSAMVTLNGTTSQETTTYVGPLEIVSDATGLHNRYHLTAYGKPVAIVDLENPAGGSPVINNQYLLTDHLGSIDLATDATGMPVSGTGWSFDAFGQRRDASAWNGPETSAQIQADRATATSNGVTSGVTHRGHTGHEMLDHLGLVHANGRVYDPALGRFLSVDPVFQFPTNGQSLNPYSYVLNNPLSNTDPTGYSCDVSESVSACGDSLKSGETTQIKQDATGTHIKQDVGTVGKDKDGNVYVTRGNGADVKQAMSAVSQLKQMGDPVFINSSSTRENTAQPGGSAPASCQTSVNCRGVGDQVFSGDGSHQYDMQNIVCSKGTAGCTSSNVFQSNLKNDYPGSDGLTPVKNLGQYAVLYPTGSITTIVEPQLDRVINWTNDDHIFYKGLVIRSTVETNSAVSIRTYGEGINAPKVWWMPNAVSRGLNNLLYMPAWNLMDRRIRTDILSRSPQGRAELEGDAARSDVQSINAMPPLY